MKTNIKIAFTIIVIIFASFIVYYKVVKPNSESNPSVTAENDIKGCYVATIGKDVYTLTILSQNGENFEGTLKFKNYEIDGSSGTFKGTYKNGILLGDYSFNSEGMVSVIKTAFKKEGSNFIRGERNVKTADNNVVDSSIFTYNSSSPRNVFQASDKSCAVSTISEYINNEENFSGTKSVIFGTRKVATEAREYIDQQIADFRKTADIEVPDMRKEFGADSPTANYMIYLDAQYLDGGKTESMVISQYVYTGGANGSSSFKVITADSQSEKILSLSNVIQESKKSDFVKLVKSELKNWKIEGNDSFILFDDTVDGLTFESFRNWSLDDKNLIIYFDKYEIGPGVIGAVDFPIPLEKLANFLTTF